MTHDYQPEDASPMEVTIAQLLKNRIEGREKTQMQSILKEAFGDGWETDEERTLLIYKMLAYVVDMLPQMSLVEDLDDRTIRMQLIEILYRHFGDFIRNHRLEHDEDGIHHQYGREPAD